MNNDYELIYLAKENNELAIEALLKKYYNYLYKKAFFYSKISNIDIEELLNESLISFYNAINSYNDKQKFSTYLNVVINNNLINYIKKNHNKKNKILNNSISYDSTILLNDIDYSSNPENILIEEEKYYEIKNKIISNTSWKEELVLELIEQNFSCKEISKITDISLRTVYNIINRIQKNIVKLMSN